MDLGDKDGVLKGWDKEEEVREEGEVTTSGIAKIIKKGMSRKLHLKRHHLTKRKLMRIGKRQLRRLERTKGKRLKGSKKSKRINKVTSPLKVLKVLATCLILLRIELRVKTMVYSTI